MSRLVVACMGVVWLLAAAGPSRASDCTAGQYKASGDYAKRVASCHSKAVKSGNPVDPLCLAKAVSKLQTVTAKAEAKGDCLGASVTSEIQDAADQGLDEIAVIIDPPPGVCCGLGASVCTWAVDATACAAIPGATAGPAGSVCRADGTCGAPPAGLGICCEGVTSGPIVDACVVSPSLTEPACTGASGVLHGAAACRADQLCHD